MDKGKYFIVRKESIKSISPLHFHAPTQKMFDPHCQQPSTNLSICLYNKSISYVGTYRLLKDLRNPLTTKVLFIYVLIKKQFYES